MIIYTRLKNKHKLKPYYYLQIFKEGTGVRACLTIDDEDDCFYVIKEAICIS